MNEDYLPKFLFGWVVIGYILGFDFHQFYSCVIGPDYISDIYNIYFTLVSLVLIGLVINSENIQFKQIVIILEILIWIFKLMIFKGGYEYSFDLIIIFHDVISMGLRLLLVSYIFNERKLISVKIILLGLIFFVIKFNFFAHPLALVKCHK